jgi:hypothetical protein
LSLSDQIVLGEGVLVPHFQTDDGVASPHKLETLSPSRIPSTVVSDAGLPALSTIVQHDVRVLSVHSKAYHLIQKVGVVG